MVQTLCNLTHRKPSCESHHMRHEVSYGKSHTSIKNSEASDKGLYILKMADSRLSYARSVAVLTTKIQ